MNINKICAAVSALCFAGTAVTLSMNNLNNDKVFALENPLGDVDGNGVIDGVDASTILSYYAQISTNHDGTTPELRSGDVDGNGVIDGVDASAVLSYYAYISANHDGTTLEQFIDKQNDTPANKLKSGGDTFTVAVWNADEYPRLISTWLDVSDRDLVDYFSSQTYRYDRIHHPDSPMFRTPSGAGLNIVKFGVGGGEAAEHYDQMFASGEDMDVYYCESEWMNKYINDDKCTAPLSDLGFTDEDLAQTYEYTDKIGHNKNGVRKAVAPFICPGGFAYRTDLAEHYLGIKSPSEMQSAVGNWDDFVSTAQKISEKTNGNLALADTVGGMYQAYRMSHRMVDKDENLTADARAFADYAKTLWDCGGVTKNIQWSDEWINNGLQDKVMGYFVPSWGLNGYLRLATENTPGQWELIQGPEAFYWGGMYTVVNSATDNADDCASFIRSSCLDKKNMLKTAENDIYYLPNNKEAVSEIVKNPSLTAIGSVDTFGTKNYLNVLADTAENITFTPYTYQNESDVELFILNTIQKNYLTGYTSWSVTETACKSSKYWPLIK